MRADNHNILMQAYVGTLDILEEMLESSPFLLGTRPSLGDFGLYGQLGQCAGGQGFLFSRPMPPDDLARLLVDEVLFLPR